MSGNVNNLPSRTPAGSAPGEPAATSGNPASSAPEGLSGITRSKRGTFYEVISAGGFKSLSPGQIATVHKAANGDEKAKAALAKDGITLKETDAKQAAANRSALVAAGREALGSDKKAYEGFITQQDRLGGNRPTGRQAAFGGLLSKGDLNAHGVVSVSGKDKQLFQVTRTDGKSPTKKDIELGTKAANGDEAARAKAAQAGLVVTATPQNAAALLGAKAKTPRAQAQNLGAGNQPPRSGTAATGGGNTPAARPQEEPFRISDLSRGGSRA